MSKITKTKVNRQKVLKNQALRAYRDNAETLGRYLAELYNGYIDGFPEKMAELTHWLNEQDIEMGNTIEGKLIEVSDLKKKLDKEMNEDQDIKKEYDQQQLKLEVDR
jgi:hypothetical protein